MHPYLIQIGSFRLPTYGFLFASGILLGIIFSMRLAKREKIDLKIFTDFIFFLLLFSIVGAKLLLLLTNLRYYLDHPSEMKYLLTSGGTYFGGLAAGVLFAFWYIRRHRLSFRQMGDIITPALALGHFFGRLGCFAVGCCYGRPCHDSWLGVTFTNLEANRLTGVPLFTPIYPTQLMEAILNLVNFFLLYVLYRRKKFAGQIFVFYIFNYSLIRFFLEYLRGDFDRGYVLGGQAHPFSSLSLPQVVSLAGMIAAIILYRIFKKLGDKKNQA